MTVSRWTNEGRLLNSGWLGRVNPDEVEALLAGGANPNVRRENGWTPLHIAAAQHVHPDIVAHLLKHGADPNVRDNGGWTPLRVAVAQEVAGSAALLLAHGADPNAQDREGQTPLHIAAERNTNSNIVARLLARGAEPNACTPEGQTPLHVAAETTTKPAVVDLLLDHGADTSLRDNKGNSPVDLAAKNRAIKGTRVFQRLCPPQQEESSEGTFEATDSTDDTININQGSLSPSADQAGDTMPTPASLFDDSADTLRGTQESPIHNTRTLAPAASMERADTEKEDRVSDNRLPEGETTASGAFVFICLFLILMLLLILFR